MADLDHPAAKLAARVPRNAWDSIPPDEIDDNTDEAIRLRSGYGITDPTNNNSPDKLASRVPRY